MVRRNNKPPKNNSKDNSDPTKTALWTQVVITIGGIAVAAIAAYQAIKLAQLQSPADTPTSVPSPIPLNTMVNTTAPTLVSTDTATPINTGTPTPITPIQRIDFDYTDSPTKHGWQMTSEATEEEVDIEHTYDQFMGNAISITSPVKYGMDFRVGLPAGQRGKIIELVAKIAEDAYVYTYVSLVRDDGSTTKGWLKLTIREGPPKPVDDDEWQLMMEQVSPKGGDWVLYQIDLEDAVMQTFGRDAWKFQQLEMFRVRGNLSLDYIHIYETRP